MIQLAKTSFSPALQEAAAKEIARILASGQLMLGPWKDRFETEFAKFVGVPHAVSVNSCTTALQICLSYAGVKGYDVLVPSGSFVTDVSAVLFAGGNPVLMDMNPETLALDLADAAGKITPKTKAMIWVHLTGVISHQYRDIARFAKDRGLFLIEDAAHAFGSEIGGVRAGALADASCFSFYPTKMLTTGTGGMIATADDKLREYAEQMRLFGKEAATGEIIHLGNDWFLDEIGACIGALSLTDIERQIDRRRAIAERYQTALANQPGIRLVQVPAGCHPGWYQYPIFLDDRLNHGDIVAALKEKHGIAAKAIYKPTHREQVFRHLDDGSLKNTERTLGRSLCLPMHVELSDQDVDKVAAALIVECRARL